MKKESVKFYFSVEGDTEGWYLDWLSETINQSNPSSKVKIVYKVDQHPFSYVKTLSFLGRETPEITHLLDIESNDKEHITKFQAALSEMKDAKIQRGVNYILGYSNFTFDLWMILHKKDCYGSFTSREQYLKEVNRAFGTQYDSLDTYKSENEFKRILAQLTLDDVKAAIARAKKIMAQNKENGVHKEEYKGYTYYTENPALSIGEAIEKILDACML